MSESTKKPLCESGSKKQYMKTSSPDSTSNGEALGSLKIGVGSDE